MRPRRHWALLRGPSTSPLDAMQELGDIRPIHAIDHIRRHPEMYCPGGVTSGCLATGLLRDAEALGARHVRLDVVDQWYLISAEIDWLGPPLQTRASIADLFRQAVPFEAVGPNGVRSEVIVAAFARSGIVATPEGWVRVFGKLDPPDNVKDALCPNGCIRTVGFILNGI